MIWENLHIFAWCNCIWNFNANVITLCMLMQVWGITAKLYHIHIAYSHLQLMHIASFLLIFSKCFLEIVILFCTHFLKSLFLILYRMFLTNMTIAMIAKYILIYTNEWREEQLCCHTYVFFIEFASKWE